MENIKFYIRRLKDSEKNLVKLRKQKIDLDKLIDWETERFNKALRLVNSIGRTSKIQ